MRAEKWVMELKPDDLVILHHGGHARRRSVRRVVKVSKTGQVTVDGGCVFFPSGWQRGGGIYTKSYIKPYDPDEAEKIKDENEHERLAGKLGGMTWRDWQEVPLPVVREVWKLVQGKGEAHSD